AILNIQRNKSTTVEPDIVEEKVNKSYLDGVRDRKYLGGKDLKITSTNSSIKFSITGDEITLIQGIERDNSCASEIEVYIDGVLHETMNNWNNSPIGTDRLEFAGDGTTKQFDLGRAFTFGH